MPIPWDGAPVAMAVHVAVERWVDEQAAVQWWAQVERFVAHRIGGA